MLFDHFGQQQFVLEEFPAFLQSPAPMYNLETSLDTIVTIETLQHQIAELQKQLAALQESVHPETYFSVYKPGIFRFSDEEKAQLTKDFLAAISVSQIDALVVHSSGIYPGLHLCLDNNLLVKSLIMLNPGTYSYDMKAVRHIKFLRRIVAGSEVPVIMKILEYLGPILLKLGKVPVRTDNFLDPLLSATTMIHANIPEAKAKFLHLSQKKFPMLYAFSKDDKLIGDKCSYELANLLGVSNAEIYTYDKDGIMINEGKNCSVLKVMSFEKGSHYVFWKHADIIHRTIEDFLRRNMINV
ncbi:hypothetical protein AVEN_167262-1 [Araneus ventricosus]|uniref:Uncharacterized protein n=1 Tax=Araneus ventricosus TaxID=182803 RepID=A0A4Y2HFZ4_ARAVE|nr:hypothetical protein AVEN_167262-1 [Araneus ventricosus]